MPDLVVVGGGPVGLVTALYARRLGLSVAVVEPRGPPIDKACGEGLMPAAVGALEGLEVAPPGVPFVGIRYVRGGADVAARFSAAPGLGVRRTTLHAALWEAACREGVEWCPWSVARVSEDPTGVVVTPGPRGSALRARYVVAADGLHSPTRRCLGLEVPAGGSTAKGPRAGCRRGLRRHYAIAPWDDHVEVHWGAVAEAYVTPVEPGLVGVAVLTASRGSFDDHLAGFPLLRERLAGGEPVGNDRGAGPFGRRARRVVAGRVLFAGDASGYADAITGEGLAVGFAQAREAARCVARDRPSAYSAAWAKVTLPSALATRALVAATRPAPARRLVVPAARALPGLFRLAVDGLAGAR